MWTWFATSWFSILGQPSLGCAEFPVNGYLGMHRGRTECSLRFWPILIIFQFLFSFNFILKYNYSTSEKSHLQYNEFPPFGHIHTTSTHIFKKTRSLSSFPLLYITCPSTVVITVLISHIMDPVCLVVVWILWETDSQSEIRVQDIYQGEY